MILVSSGNGSWNERMLDTANSLDRGVWEQMTTWNAQSETGVCLVDKGLD